MSDEAAQPITGSEPTPTSAGPQSAPVVDPVASQSPTEPTPAATAEPTTPTMPPEAPEAPRTIDTSNSTNIPEALSTAPEPQTPPSAPVSTSIETPITQTPVPLPTVTVQAPNPRSFLAKALEKIQFRKRAKLEKIMKFASGRKEITNDQVEKLLHISDSTAQRYLIQLAKEGKLRRIGKDGSSRYEPLNGSNPTN